MELVEMSAWNDFKKWWLVQRFINELINEIDGLARQLRRKPQMAGKGAISCKRFGETL